MRLLISLIFFCYAHGYAHAQKTLPDLKITPLTGDFYIYETYGHYQGSRIPANAMYLVTSAGVVIFDTPWDSTQFRPLLDSIEARHHQPVILCISTHFHEDRTAGLEYYRSLGIKTYTTKLTDSLSTIKGMKRAEFLLEKDTSFHTGQYRFSTYYPGPGHAPDNIVIWFEQERILYGGCLIKSTADETLGNLSDASPAFYASTIKNVMRHCPAPLYIITGHNDWTDTGSLKHTLRMAVKLAAQ